MEIDEIESYEAYKNFPHEALSLPDLSNEEKREYELYEALMGEFLPHGIPTRAAKLQEYYKKKLFIVNDVDKKLETGTAKGKNKGKKKRERAKKFAENRHYQENCDITTKSSHPVGYLSRFLRDVFPDGIIKRETYSNIYVLCPYHEEDTASMCISKKKGIVKCYGCGKAHLLSTFLSMSLGNTKHYRQKQIELASSGNYKFAGSVKKESGNSDYNEEERY